MILNEKHPYKYAASYIISSVFFISSDIMQHGSNEIRRIEMIEVKIENGKCTCNVDGDPSVLAAELVLVEKAVFDELSKNSLIDLTAFGLTYHSLLKTISESAYTKANLKCNCEKED